MLSHPEVDVPVWEHNLSMNINQQTGFKKVYNYPRDIFKNIQEELSSKSWDILDSTPQSCLAKVSTKSRTW